MAATSAKPFQPDTDIHVTFDDQSKINKFAKHNAKLEELKTMLSLKKNDLKCLEEAIDEIELFDADEQVPYVIGEVFISYDLEQTQALLAKDTARIQGDIKRIEGQCRELEGFMKELKDALYLRFGSNIYLESDE